MSENDTAWRFCVVCGEPESDRSHERAEALPSCRKHGARVALALVDAGRMREFCEAMFGAVYWMAPPALLRAAIDQGRADVPPESYDWAGVLMRTARIDAQIAAATAELARQGLDPIEAAS